MNRLLHLALKVLYAHAESVKAKPAQCFKMRLARDAWIDFNTDLGIRSKLKFPVGVLEQIFHLCRAQICRRASAPVKLNRFATTRNRARDVVDFPLQSGEIGNEHVLILLNRDIAGTKKTEAFAEGKMHVERYGRAASIRASTIGLEIVRAKILSPNRRRWIARVARAGLVVLLEQRVRNLLNFKTVCGFGVDLVHCCAETIAAWPAWTNARALATGVLGKMP